MWTIWAAGLMVVMGCGPGGSGPATRGSSETAAAPAAPPDERDRLWALAPEGAKVGVVVSSRGVAMLERGALAVQELLGSSADFAAMNSKVMHSLMETVGTPQPTMAGFGMTHDKPLAAFVAANGEIAVVPPVADRSRFVAALHGTQRADGDAIGSWVCKTVDGRYICATRGELFAALGKHGLDAMRRTVQARGDIEVAGDLVVGRLGKLVAAAAELDRGTVIVRGALAGGVLGILGAPGRPRAESAAAAGFGVADLGPMLASLPAQASLGGVPLAELGRDIDGPSSYVVAAGTGDPDIRVPLGDPGFAKTIVEHCTELQPLAALGATVNGAACRLPIGGAGSAIDAWIEGKELRIANRAAAKPSPIAPSPFASELAQGQWSAALFGRGAYLAAKPLPSPMPELVGQIEVVLRSWALVSELGLGIRKHGESFDFVVAARTIWANPDDVVHKLLAISADDLRSGKAVEIGKAIAAAAPQSLFAQDVQAGKGGLVAVLAAFGGAGTLIIPAWTAQQKRAEYRRPQIHLGDGAGQKPVGGFPLVAARAALKTTIFMKPDRTPAPTPPKDRFIKSRYRRGTAELVAYETPLRPGARRPAIVWITGGFNWGIDRWLWKPAPRSNDQTASAFRRPDIVVMFPSLRGFNGNPGKPECFLGEIDDILAAAEHIAQRPDVDPARIYLGGHSTGGTLVLLAAASTDRFRAVFAFGPAADPLHYGESGCLPLDKPDAEYIARAPANWMGSIVSPTLVIEGEDGNTDAFPQLQERASSAVKFAAIVGADHGSVLAPATEAIARAIVADTGPNVSITLDMAAIARGVEHPQ